METSVLLNKINILPNSLKEEVNDFIDFLLSKNKKDQKAKSPEVLDAGFDSAIVQDSIKSFEGIDPVQFIREIRDEE